MRGSRTPHLVAITFGALLAAVPTWAQTAPPASAMSPSTMPTFSRPTELHQQPPTSMADVERHIMQLRDQLAITPAEQPQWDTFAQIMKDNAQSMSTTFSERAQNIGTMNAADNMQSYARLAQVHADNMQKLSSAFKALYDGFPTSQKRVADRVFKSAGQRAQ